jgi:hypothetical protein
VCHGEGHGRGEELGDAASKNPPGYREWNAQKVNSGTGEALPGPATAGARCSLTGEPREVSAGQEGGGWGRTTNAIESTFATVRLRTNKTKGSGSRTAGLAMAYKLLTAAQERWRCVNAPHLVALVRAGATFVDGMIIERDDQRYAA